MRLSSKSQLYKDAVTRSGFPKALIRVTALPALSRSYTLTSVKYPLIKYCPDLSDQIIKLTLEISNWGGPFNMTSTNYLVKSKYAKMTHK